MAIKFNLNKDMTDKEIIKELDGRTSGETRQELEQFFAPSSEVKFNLPSHNVLMEDGEYAIIAKSVQNKTPFGHYAMNYEYWLAGLNDEGKYFCHPLTGYVGKPKIEAVLEWTNRTDEGYIKRIQGDVLLQFARVEKQGNDQIEVRSHNRNFWIRINPYSQKERNLNNHKLTTDGQIEQQGDCTIVMGTHLILQHPQHGMIEEKIPESHAAVLTNQRGRFRNGGFD